MGELPGVLLVLLLLVVVVVMGECFRVVVLLLVAGVVTVVTVTPAVTVCCCVAPATEASEGAPAAELRVPEGDVRTSAALARKSSPPLSMVARQSIGIHSMCSKQVNFWMDCLSVAACCLHQFFLLVAHLRSGGSFLRQEELEGTPPQDPPNLDWAPPPH